MYGEEEDEFGKSLKGIMFLHNGFDKAMFPCYNGKNLMKSCGRYIAG